MSRRLPLSVAVAAATRCRAWGWAVLLALVMLLSGLPDVLAQGSAPEPRVRRPASVMVEVLDDRGQPLTGLTADRVTVREGGQARPILGVAGPAGASAPAEPWRITLYLDLALSAESSAGWVGRVLEERAAELVELGWVEVVAAGEEPRLLLPATRDPSALAAALGRVFLLEKGEDRLVEQRGRVLDLLATADEGEERRRALDAAAVDEASMVRARQGAMLAWLADRTSAGPRAVVLVSNGFDLDPASYYRQAAGGGAAAEAVAEPALAPATRELGRALAAYGWVVLAVAPQADDSAAASRFGAAAQNDPATGDPQILGRVRLPRRRSAAEKAEQELEDRRREDRARLLPQRPEEPLEILADATGGEVLTSVAGLPGALDRLRGRWRVEFTSVQAPDAEPQPLTVEIAGAGRPALAARWIGGATPQAVSSLRARRVLEGDEAPGGLAVRGLVSLAAGEGAAARVKARVSTDEPAGVTEPPAGPFRVTVASLDLRGEVTIEHRRVTAADSAAGALDLPLGVSPAVERVALVVEELDSGRWGGGLAALVAAVAAETPGAEAAEDAETSFFDADLGLLPAPKAVNLLRPEGRVQRGSVRFDTVVSDPAVARVEFLLDGRPAARRDSAPYSATLDLGKLPLMRRVEALAYRADGSLIARDVLVVNEGGRDFAVQITEPSSIPGAGPVDFAAEVTVPPGREVERVELYLGETRLATLFEPPYRHRLVVRDGSSGFLRAVARLDTGATVEDVFFLDERGSSERVDVNLVELYVVVSDRAGRPVRGLDQQEFEVREDGAAQQLASFGEAGDLALTVGLAIDSSASMFAKLPAVQEAARTFLTALEPGRDRAFLVDFDDRPLLAAEPTLELDRVGTAIGRLQSSGRTSLWESVVFSLVQLQGQQGRKALVVYSDGADQDESFSYRTCLRFARKLGIPIYVIVSNNEAVRTDGLGLRSFGDRLDRLTSAVGGRTFLVRTGEDLTAIYAEIERELSSQYLLTYYSDGPPRNGAWREVEVDVRRRGLNARTVAGYQL